MNISAVQAISCRRIGLDQGSVFMSLHGVGKNLCAVFSVRLFEHAFTAGRSRYLYILMVNRYPLLLNWHIPSVGPMVVRLCASVQNAKGSHRYFIKCPLAT